MAMHLVLEFIRTSMFTDKQRESGINRLLYIDEAQILMGFPETAHFLEFTARTCRKFGIGLTVMTQNVGVFVTDSEGVANKVGRAILGNCSIKVLLKQEPSEADAVRDAFRLTEGELSRLLASRSGEGLVIVGRESSWFTAVDLASPWEHAMLTTTTSERAQIAEDERLQIEAAQANFDNAEYDDSFFDEPLALPPGESLQQLDAPSPFEDDLFANPFAFDDDAFGEDSN
jgi:hypothetical protein